MIEAKHLTPYLPYSLKVVMEGKKTNVAWMSTKNIAVIRPDGIGEYKRIKWEYAHLNVKPILKPMSYLKEYSPAIYEYGWLPHKNVFGMQHLEALVLFENHFDVFGLIDKGLAVSEKIKEKAKQTQA